MKRLDFIASLLKGYDTVLDIGSDHGYVLKKALDQNFIKKGIASEIAEGPLANAKSNLLNYPVTFYLSDGFDKIKADFDIAVISGMGVYTIIDIIKNGPKKPLILQPNDKLEILREHLSENGYKILDEYITFDKFYYIILKVEPGVENLTDEDIYLGPKLRLNPLAKDYYQKKYDQLNEILLVCDKETKKTIKKQINYLKKVI